MTPGFTGVISDLGGPTANMYRLNCKDKKVEETCRRPSCVYPSICVNLETDHSHTTQLYRKTRDLPGVKKWWLPPVFAMTWRFAIPNMLKSWFPTMWVAT